MKTIYVKVVVVAVAIMGGLVAVGYILHNSGII
jgi:hypothetical protein